MSTADKSKAATTGTAGLDYVLRGGLPRDRVYLVQGDPGAGKTTLALQFLFAGAELGEKCLYITLSETLEETRSVCESHGWDLSKIEVFVQHLDHRGRIVEDTNTLFHSDEVELVEATEELQEVVNRIRPTRIVLDSLSEFRLLAQSAHRYRRHILALKQFFSEIGATVLFLDDRTSDLGDIQLHSIPHGVIELEQVAPLYGTERRRIRVIKLRGLSFRGGYHDFRIEKGGLRVFPRLVAADHPAEFPDEMISSGVAQIDDLLKGGIPRGNSTLLMGPAGAGKSALATQYASAAAERGENVAIFMFDESMQTLRVRSRALGLSIDQLIESGQLRIQQVDPAEMSTGEFSELVRREVELRNVRVLIIDSLNGYMNAMAEERNLILHMHELLSYLGQQGVTTFLVVAQHGLLGSAMASAIDVSYLADTVILLRYFEVEGEIRKAISIVKKRSGDHERTIREFRVNEDGIRVGPPLRDFRGVLTGTPEFLSDVRSLFGSKSDPR